MAAPSAVTPILDAALKHEALKANAKSTTNAATSTNIPPSSEIRILHPSEYAAAAQTLATAFSTDPIVRYPIDTPDSILTASQRDTLHLTTMQYLVYAHCLNGLVLTTGPDYACVALWLPPSRSIDSLLTILRSGMWRLNFLLTSTGKQRFFTEFLPLLSRTKTSVLGEKESRSWYLNYIGTKPQYRGRGYAKKLVRYVTDQADRTGEWCYLESSHEANLGVYAGLGFGVRGRIYLGGEGNLQGVEEGNGDANANANANAKERDQAKVGKSLKMDVMVREPRGQAMEGRT